jgi:hypothetical protein
MATFFGHSQFSSFKPATELNSQTHALIKKYFGDSLDAKIEQMVIDKIMLDAPEYFQQTTTQERKVWLYGKAASILQSYLDPANKTIGIPFGKLSTTHESLIDLLVESNFLRAELNAAKTEDKINRLEQSHDSDTANYSQTTFAEYLKKQFALALNR